MAFDLELMFSGVCGFVPDSADLAAVTKLCVLLPNAADAITKKPKGLDGVVMRRHKGLLRLPLANLDGVNAPDAPTETEVLWELDRTLIRIEPKGIRYPDSTMSFAWYPNADPTSPTQQE